MNAAAERFAPRTRTGHAALILAALLVLLNGCDRNRPPQDSETATATSQPARTPGAPPAWSEPTEPAETVATALPRVAPPPPALPPVIPAGVAPTRYANARVGQQTVMQQAIGETQTTRTTEVLRVTAETVYVRQTIESGPHTWSNEMTFHRFVDTPAEEPSLGGDVVGTERITVNGNVLNCERREGQDGGTRFRIWTCPDVFGWVVRHEQQVRGQWVRVLDLVDFSG